MPQLKLWQSGGFGLRFAAGTWRSPCYRFPVNERDKIHSRLTSNLSQRPELIFQLREGSPSQGNWTAVVFLPVPLPAIVRHRPLCTFTNRNVAASTTV